MDRVARSSKNRGGRVGPRDLLSEAQLILHRASGALSLRDHLQGDSKPQDNVIALLKDCEDAPDKPQPLIRTGAKCSAQDNFINIPVGQMDVGHPTKNAGDTSQAEEFTKYFEVYPDLVEGSHYFNNSGK